MSREFIDTTGKTIDDAIHAALKELNMEREDVSVEILTQPKQGFLGIGGTSAKVRVYYEAKDEGSKAEVFLNGLFEKMDMSCQMEVKETVVNDEARMEINLSGKDMGVIIGRRGEMLDAVQYITSLVVNKSEDKHVRVTLDTENYRAKREESLVGLAKRMAEKALKFKKNVTLEPMNSHERRVIHSALQEVAGVTTFSTGSEPYRRVVISVENGRTADRRPQTDRKPQPYNRQNRS